MKIILTRGCSGSGKTTWAEEQVKKNPDTVNINRDDLRKMMFVDYKYTKQREALVTDAQFLMAQSSLDKGLSVIISDTNINKATQQKWEDFAERNKTKVKYQDFVVDFETLKKRNEKRGMNSVPIDVLRNQYIRFTAKEYKFSQEDPKAILFDIDGTLADHNGRSAYDLDKLKNDLLIESTLELLNFYKSDYKIIIFSGREVGAYKEHQVATEMWLKKNDVHYDYLQMRLHKDHRPDYIIKDEMLRRLKGYNVVLAVDDRQQVVDMYRLNGLRVHQVAFGDF